VLAGTVLVVAVAALTLPLSSLGPSKQPSQGAGTDPAWSVPDHGDAGPWDTGPPQHVDPYWEVLVKGGCQGVIVAPRVVLTSASCTLGREPADLEVAAMGATWSDAQMRKVDHIVDDVSEDRDPATGLALLVLTEPLDPDGLGAEIPLASAQEIAHADAGRVAHNMDGAAANAITLHFWDNDVDLPGDAATSRDISATPWVGGTSGDGFTGRSLVIAGADGEPALAGIAAGEDTLTFTNIAGPRQWIERTLDRVEDGFEPLPTDRLPVAADGSPPAAGDPDRPSSRYEDFRFLFEAYQVDPTESEPPDNYNECSYPGRWVVCDSYVWEENRPYDNWPPLHSSRHLTTQQIRTPAEDVTCHALRFDDDGRLIDHVDMRCSTADSYGLL
jgi:hypothetical protein